MAFSKNTTAKSAAPPSAKSPPKEIESGGGVVVWLREWIDALVVAYLLAMFIRMFVVELFKIPSPSMTPTLLGTEEPKHAVGYADVNGDGLEDMLLRGQMTSTYANESYDVYLKQADGRYIYDGVRDPGSLRPVWRKKASERQDRIIVGKFLYWFTPPARGDIVVFKVPEKIFQKDKPIYIKRVTGLPGESITFEATSGPPGHENTMGYLMADGKRVESPPFFKTQKYEFRHMGGGNRPPYISCDDYGATLRELRVPEESIFVFGDNTVSSQDSRYWGKVDFKRLRGRAIFRYNPRYFPFFKDPGFLK